MSTATEPAPAKKRFEFPGAVTVLVLVTFLVWLLTLLLPAGQYDTDELGAPIPGTFHGVDSALSFGERLGQLLLSPINGLYGVQDGATGFVGTDNLGALFGSVGVVLFILALGSFIAVSFSTRALEVAVAQLAGRMRQRGWLLIVVIMALFSLLGSTMGFSVETFGFYALLLPLMAALGYDRMTTAAMVILSCGVGTMASTVNPFSIGVASGEAGTSIGDGIVLRAGLWGLLTALAIAFVVRYAERVRRDPSRSLVAADLGLEDDDAPADDLRDARLSRGQRWTLVITGLTFLVMIFSVIPWSAIFGGSTAPGDYDTLHEVAVEPYWFELNWWFPELTLLFALAAVLIGLVNRMGEKRIVSLVTSGAGDMIGPALVIMLARGVAVLMTNTQTLDTVLNAMEQLVDGAGAGVFAVLAAVVNVPLAFLIPSSSGHATLAMPLLAPLADFAGVSRPLTITAFQLGHGLMLLFSPTNVVVVGGLAIAKVGFDRYLRFLWPLLVVFAVIVLVVLFVAASLG